MKKLNDAAKLLLLQAIEANGGSIERGALREAMRELVDSEHVQADFGNKIRVPGAYASYDFVLTEKGKKVILE